jgi:hypothetical protein
LLGLAGARSEEEEALTALALVEILEGPSGSDTYTELVVSVSEVESAVLIRLDCRVPAAPTLRFLDESVILKSMKDLKPCSLLSSRNY